MSVRVLSRCTARYTPRVPLALSLTLLLAAFLSGSIPCGYLIARAKGVDIRTRGSGNIGATNTGRVLGARYGFLCFGLDFLKGLAPSLLAGMLVSGAIASPLAGALSPAEASLLRLGVALAAVLGHMHPPWLGFKGGKGISCGFGALIGIYPVFTLGAIVAILVWGIVLALTRMVGIASVIGAIALTIVVGGSRLAPPAFNDSLARFSLYKPATTIEACFAAALCVLIIYKHRANIVRTFKGTELKVGGKKAA